MKTNTFFKGLNYGSTANGATNYKTTWSENLDLFASNVRGTDKEKLEHYFIRAYNEDKAMAVKNLLNILDIRGGKGERQAFKTMFAKLITLDIELAEKVLNAIGELGRWDYILVAEGTKLEAAMFTIIHDQLHLDITSNDGDSISLLAKWLPSANASNQETRRLGKKIAKELFKGEREYRKTLSKLRAEIAIIENNLRKKEYNFDYSHVPSKANLKYSAAFKRNDESRYQAFLESLSKGEVKANASVLTPSELVAATLENTKSDELINGLWANLKDIKIPEDARVLPMIDVSESMHRSLGYGWNRREFTVETPIVNSVALGVYFAERATGAFKDKYLSFSANPELVTLSGKPADRIRYAFKEHRAYNTNIDLAFAAILDAARNANEEDVPTHLLIVSDMEFDGNYDIKTPNYEIWKKSFANAGLKLPKIIFWNVYHGGENGYPVTKETENVALVSGYSPNIVDNLFNLSAFTPESIMVETLSKYDKYL